MIRGCLEYFDGIIRRILFRNNLVIIIKNPYLMVKSFNILVLVVVMAITGWVVEAKAAGKVTMTPTSVPTEILAPTGVIEVKTTNYLENQTAIRLEGVLNKQKVGSFQGWNGLRILIRMAIDKGVRADTVVLLLLLPMIATLVGVLHYFFGLTGYGIFTPTMIAVALVATGIFGGLTLFAMILAVSLLANLTLSKLKLHFWPARSINLLFISLGTFGLMIGSSFFELLDIRSISIFPVLLMILLAEDFVRTQLVKSKNEARRLMIGTLILSVAGALVTNIRPIQEWVILYPEVVVLIIILVNLLVGSYTGIRLSEFGRFKKAIRK